MADQDSREASSSATGLHSNVDQSAARDEDSRSGAKTPEASRKKLKSLQTYQFDGSRTSSSPQSLDSLADPAPDKDAREQSIGSPDSDPRSQRRRPNASIRRASSKVLPYRGQEFSVDDDVEEVQGQKKSASSGTLKRTPSTIRRRATAPRVNLPPVESSREEDEQAAADADRSMAASGTLTRTSTTTTPASVAGGGDEEAHEVERVESDQDGDVTPQDDADADDADLSDAESFTLKDRQEAINETHPFGIRIWKPALYKKGRSVEKDAEGDIHSSPGGNVSRWLWLFNSAWTLLFGWWLALFAAAGALLCFLLSFAPGCKDYGIVFWGLAGYIFYPFGKFVKLISDEAYLEEDEGEGRSISEYERWQTGDLEEGRLFFGPVRSLIGRRRSDEESDDEGERASLLGRSGRAEESNAGPRVKRRLFGRGDWNLGRVVFFILFYGVVGPLLGIVSLICWLFVFTIPMGRVTFILLDHLRRRPLAIEFHAASAFARKPGSQPSSIVLCTYRAVGLRYWKYTIDGTNIFLINLLAVVAFVIFDYFVLYEVFEIHAWFTNNIFVFLLALFSIIPLAYFIGQAVASISAQSTMGVGAVINAFFSTLVEVFLYCVALSNGKARLVEGSVIGSIFAGILFLPGVSMCFGAIRRKTQRFNVKSAGVTTTMLLFAVIGAFGPTLFYQIFGSHEMNCMQCEDENGDPLDRDCRKCFFAQIPNVDDPFYVAAVRPFTYFASVTLFLAYLIGLLFTLRTHAATIWNTEMDEKKEAKMEEMAHRVAASTTNASATPTAGKRTSIDYGTLTSPRLDSAPSVSRTDIKDSQLYKRILNQSLKQAGLSSPVAQAADASKDSEQSERIQKPIAQPMRLPSGFSLSAEDSNALLKQMAEIASTSAAVATRDATQAPRRAAVMAKTSASAPSMQHQTLPPSEHSVAKAVRLEAEGHIPHPEAHQGGGGHDAPNWSRNKSCAILLVATIAYAIVAEILVDTVDAVLENVDIDEKFLGITLFALVPNTTEFLNAISFAMNGNIALSMEIGSAYALQVCLLQIPALVLFSVFNVPRIDPEDVIDHTFVLLFPQWDMVTVILCVFLLSYMYGEGKSNYFKGSILILAYLVVVVGFYLSDFSEGFVADPNNPYKDADRRHTRFAINTPGAAIPRREL